MLLFDSFLNKLNLKFWTPNLVLNWLFDHNLISGLMVVISVSVTQDVTTHDLIEDKGESETAITLYGRPPLIMGHSATWPH
jgi:hypothetical protein